MVVCVSWEGAKGRLVSLHANLLPFTITILIIASIEME
jgi:hypothetical protein